MLIAAWIVCVCAPRSAVGDPFAVSARLERGGAGRNVLAVSFRVPPGHYLYADSIRMEAEGAVRLIPKDVPAPKTEFDTFSNSPRRKYTHDVRITYLVSGLTGDRLLTVVHYQGCSSTVCFLPASRRLVAGFGAEAEGQPGGPAAASPPAAPEGRAGEGGPQRGGGAAAGEEWRRLAAEFHVVAQTTGYQPAREFRVFLERARRGAPTPRDRLVDLFEKGSVALTVALILLGGLALNLTPCVLPLIPMNLMIIGAGARSASRARGFWLGSSYGAGMALAYGFVGLAAAVTGAAFGSLNASPWFNLSIAGLFVMLALAMFNVFTIDLTRYQPNLTGALGRLRGAPAAFLLGGVAALLAGACVAPVVISVLVIAGNLYKAGHAVGLLLPFLLGIGMALPWPLAGAGLAVLPKPGKWMTRVKQAFGVFIFLFALYYAHVGYSLYGDRIGGGEAAHVASAQAQRIEKEGWLTSLPEALRRAKAEGRPLFIDFWASWCKSCLTMDETTFRDPEVRARLGSFVKVKYRAEDPAASPAREVLAYFGVLGLPTYVVVRPQG